MHLTTVTITLLLTLTAAKNTMPTVILHRKHGISILGGLPGNCITYAVDGPVNSVEINMPCLFYDEMNCAGNATDYLPGMKIPGELVGEVGSVRCGREEE